MAQTSQTTKSRKNSAYKNLMSIHWWMFNSYIILFMGGAFMSRLPREVVGRNLLYDFHKSVGVLTTPKHRVGRVQLEVKTLYL